MTSWYSAASVSIVLLSGVAGGAAQALGGVPVYTERQAEAGKAAYLDRCAACHASDLGGTGDPPGLAGADFIASWKGRTTKEMFDYVQSMPPGGPALSTEQYLAVVSFILQQNGAKAGEQPLTDATNVPLGSIATGERPPP